MKNVIEGFRQDYAMTLRKIVKRKDKEVLIKIDCTDLVILRWFVDFYPNMKKMIVDGKEYAWLSHNKLKEDLPLIDINKQAFIERMHKLVDFEILDYKCIKENGTFSIYSFGKNYEKLIVSNNNGICSNIEGVSGQTGTGVYVQTYNKDNDIINNKIDYKYIIDHLNEKTKSNYRSTSAKTQTLIKARVKEGFTEQDFIKVIDNMVIRWTGTEWEQYLTPDTLFGTKFEKYLNTKAVAPKKSTTDARQATSRNYTTTELNSLFTKLE